MRFCENETVNLILSSYAGKAKQSDITFSIDARLPDTLLLSDTELCSILSNALDNALRACKQIPDIRERQKQQAVHGHPQPLSGGSPL